jgi:hypothetical protein
MKQVLLIFFSFLLFFGNVGISIFTHSCREEGLSKSIFLASNDCNSNLSSDACCEEEKEDACCDAEEDKNTCCSDEIQIVKLDEKYIQNHGISKILISDFDIPTIFYHSKNVLLAEIHLCINNGKAPPPKSRKTILIQNQVFRI